MFDSYIRDHASWSPRAPAVVLPGRQVSYDEFDAEVDRLGAALAAEGLSRDRGVVSVGIAGPYLQYLATAALARLDIPSAAAEDDRADVRLTDREAAPEGGPPRLVLTRAWVEAALGAERRRLPNRLRDPLALGRVMLSSGTTGAPHRVPFSWRRLEQGNHATLRNYCHGKLGAWIPMTGIDSMMGLALVMGAWSIGASAVNALAMEDMPHWLETLPPGMLSLTPNHLRRILAALPDGFRPRADWRIICGGALLPSALAQEARLRLTPDIRLLYGATECGTIALGSAADLDDEPAQIGITPHGTTVVVVDDDGRPAPDGVSGEIRVRGPRNAPGYVDDPDATAQRFADGWFLTRDLGRRLPDGRLVLEGRVDDRMNLGGVKVMPGPLEAAALACPGVHDAAAFAVPDADGRDRCWLAVAAAPGFDRDGLAAHLADYPGLPEHRFAWIDEVPRNAMGKPERARLREAVLAVTRGS